MDCEVRCTWQIRREDVEVKTVLLSLHRVRIDVILGTEVSERPGVQGARPAFCRLRVLQGQTAYRQTTAQTYHHTTVPEACCLRTALRTYSHTHDVASETHSPTGAL